MGLTDRRWVDGSEKAFSANPRFPKPPKVVSFLGNISRANGSSRDWQPWRSTLAFDTRKTQCRKHIHHMVSQFDKVGAVLFIIDNVTRGGGMELRPKLGKHISMMVAPELPDLPRRILDIAKMPVRLHLGGSDHSVLQGVAVSMEEDPPHASMGAA